MSRSAYVSSLASFFPVSISDQCLCDNPDYLRHLSGQCPPGFREQTSAFVSILPSFSFAISFHIFVDKTRRSRPISESNNNRFTRQSYTKLLKSKTTDFKWLKLE